jgi:hypothetical protein
LPGRCRREIRNPAHDYDALAPRSLQRRDPAFEHFLVLQSVDQSEVVGELSVLRTCVPKSIAHFHSTDRRERAKLAAQTLVPLPREDNLWLSETSGGHGRHVFSSLHGFGQNSTPLGAASCSQACVFAGMPDMGS